MEKLQQFAIGQRWLSDTETELGLGVLIDVDERSISILFPKSDETRVYARNNAPLSRIIFNVNDEVQDQEGIKWIVESIEDRHGVLRYDVVRTLANGEQERKALNETRIGAQIQLSKPLERLLAVRSIIRNGMTCVLRPCCCRLKCTPAHYVVCSAHVLA